MRVQAPIGALLPSNQAPKESERLRNSPVPSRSVRLSPLGRLAGLAGCLRLAGSGGLGRRRLSRAWLGLGLACILYTVGPAGWLAGLLSIAVEAS